jgi:hypothetical protein
LLSIEQLCDNGCTATFTTKEVRVTAQNGLVLRGIQDPTTRLWKIPLTPPAPCNDGCMIDERMEDEGLGYVGFNLHPHQANSAYHTTNQIDHISFLHAACGYPFPSTWIQAIDRGHFAKWPGLTADPVQKHLPKSIPTVLGHQHQQRQNIRTTHPILALADDDLTPVTELANIATHMVFSAITDTHNEIATDLTGQFPTVSGLGNPYIS